MLYTQEDPWNSIVYRDKMETFPISQAKKKSKTKNRINMINLLEFRSVVQRPSLTALGHTIYNVLIFTAFWTRKIFEESKKKGAELKGDFSNGFFLLHSQNALGAQNLFVLALN